MVLQYRQGAGCDSICCLVKVHILNDVGLNLETKNESPPVFVFILHPSVCIFLSFWVLFWLSLICTLPLLAYHWQEIGRSFFLTSHLKLGVSLQFPLLKNELSVFSTYSTFLTHAAHWLHVRRRERVAAGSSSPRLSDFQSLSWILCLLLAERGGCSSGAVGSTRWDVWMVIDMWPYHISISTNLLKKNMHSDIQYMLIQTCMFYFPFKCISFTI